MSDLPSRGRAFVDLLRAAWIEYERDRARYLAVAMTYYALLSLVPLLSLLLAALGLLLRFSTIGETRRQLLVAIEGRVGPELSAAITRPLSTLQQESIVATAVSLTGLLLAASLLFRHLRLTFRAIRKYEPPLISGSLRLVVRATLLESVVAFAMVLGGGGLLVVVRALIAASQWMGALPLVGDATGWPLGALSSVVLAATTFALVFRFLPPVPLRWRDVWLAALLGAVAWMIAPELLALYGVVLGGSRSPSGALGAVLAVMLWMNLTSQVLFLGAELCKVVAARNDARRRASGAPRWRDARRRPRRVSRSAASRSRRWSGGRGRPRAPPGTRRRGGVPRRAGGRRTPTRR
jgi:membrane protein